MHAQSGFVLKLAAGIAVLLAAVSCAPPQITSKTQAVTSAAEVIRPNLPAEPIDYELVSTRQIPEPTLSPEIKYEKPVTEIRTDQTVLHLSQVKMSNVALTYDLENRTLAIKGLAEIVDDAQKLLAESSFAIIGESRTLDPVITLRSATKEKINSNLKPVVRAQATCLATNANDEPDCSRVVIDFFIAYKQKVYTEQMEIKPTVLRPKPVPVTPPPVLPTEPKTQPENSTPTVTAAGPQETSELQKEETETSVPGRFEGQAEAVDLTKVFDPDDEIQKTLKPKAIEKKKEKEKEKDLKKIPAPAPEGKDKPINNDVSETKSGDLRPKNQAIGFPNDGALQNATSLLITQKKLDQKSFFEIAFPERQRYFATFEMAQMLTRLGERLHLQFNKNLAISDISKLNGGLLSSHRSHQIGMDADIAYPSSSDKIKFPVVVDMQTRRFNPNLFSIAKTFDLLKFAYQQEDLKIDRLFVDRAIKASLCEYAKAKGELTGPDKNLVQQLFKSIEHINGHGDHFHLRLKCTPAHPGCRAKQYIEVAGCS